MTDHHFQLVLKIVDPPTFARFVEIASPAASEAAERLLAAQSIDGSIEQPVLVNVGA